MDAATKRKIATRRKELKEVLSEHAPKLEAAKVIAEQLKKIGEDTSELDALIAAATAFTTAGNNT